MDVSEQSPTQRKLFNAGYVLMLAGLPAITWYVTIAMLHYDGALVLPGPEFWSHVEAPSALSVGFYLAWLAFQGLLMHFGPGKVEHGVPLEDGSVLPYKLNGLLALGTTILIAGGLVLADVVPATFLFDELGELVTTTNIVVALLCLYVFALGRSQANETERKMNALEAYFVGAARNPRNGTFDWKFFCESRPGMILWVLIVLSMAAQQYTSFGTVTNAMILVCAFQILYVTDYFVVEDAILTTWDIRHEPFGFMLCWGSLVWVPFTFSLQSVYLALHPVDLPLWAAAGILVLNMAGYVIFRSSNLQKHRFRSNPERLIWGKKPDFIQTQRGTKLLTSGWWGVARHSNYLGDLMMGMAWCLTCGSSRVLCFFYFIYFIILLLHRERRDNEHCARKYGSDWEQYEARVPWRILPGVY